MGKEVSLSFQRFLAEESLRLMIRACRAIKMSTGFSILSYRCSSALLFILTGCSLLQAQDKADLFARYLTGEWDNFQQCWMENTETPSHRVWVEHPHRHIHAVFERDIGAGHWVWQVSYYEGRQRQRIARYRLRLTERHDGQLQSDFFPATGDMPDSALSPPIIWTFSDGYFLGRYPEDSSDFYFLLKKDTILLLDNNLSLNHQAEPYRLLKCRFFRGWIQYPMEHLQKDSVYFYSGLLLHDQGGTARLRFPDGTLGEYTVELTQLIHSHRTPIMKLAIYDKPEEHLHWNSRAIAYAWADPQARRIGINIRKIASGWTLISNE